MADDTVVRDPSRKKFWTARNLLMIVMLPLLGFMGKLVWQEYQEYQSLVERIKNLENDRTKWAMLAELHGKVQLLEKDTTINANDILWMKWAIDHDLVRPLSQPATAPPNLRAVETPEKMDPDRFREMIQQKYPAKK